MNKSTWLLLCLCVLGAFAFLATVGPTIKPLTPSPATAQSSVQRRFQEPPKIISKVKSLQVARTAVVTFGAGDRLRLTLRNDSEKTAVSFSLCTTLDDHSRSSMTFYGPEETDEAVAPYGERTEEIPAAALEPGKPLIVCAATFADGTQEGVQHLLKSDKESYEEMKKSAANVRGRADAESLPHAVATRRPHRRRLICLGTL